MSDDIHDATVMDMCKFRPAVETMFFHDVQEFYAAGPIETNHFLHAASTSPIEPDPLHPGISGSDQMKADDCQFGFHFQPGHEGKNLSCNGPLKAGDRSQGHEDREVLQGNASDTTRNRDASVISDGAAAHSKPDDMRPH